MDKFFLYSMPRCGTNIFMIHMNEFYKNKNNFGDCLYEYFSGSEMDYVLNGKITNDNINGIKSVKIYYMNDDKIKSKYIPLENFNNNNNILDKIKMLENSKYMYIFKIFGNHINNDILIKYLNSSNYSMYVLYRNSIIDQFCSFEIAKLTNQWLYTSEIYKNKIIPKNKLKIDKLYFYNWFNEFIKKFLENLLKLKNPTYIFQYEDYIKNKSKVYKFLNIHTEIPNLPFVKNPLNNLDYFENLNELYEWEVELKTKYKKYFDYIEKNTNYINN